MLTTRTRNDVKGKIKKSEIVEKIKLAQRRFEDHLLWYRKALEAAVLQFRAEAQALANDPIDEAFKVSRRWGKLADLKLDPDYHATRFRQALGWLESVDADHVELSQQQLRALDEKDEGWIELTRVTHGLTELVRSGRPRNSIRSEDVDSLWATIRSRLD